MYARLLVAAQFCFLGLLVYTGPVWPQNFVSGLVQVASLFCGLWAILTMGIYNVRITPGIPRQNRLITTGPYKWVRHPMYTTVVLLATGWLINFYDVHRFILYITLIVVLFLKAYLEEKILIQHFLDYQNYMRRTKMFIPFAL